MKWCERTNAVPCPYFGLALTESDYLKAMKRLKVTNPPPWVSANANATAHTLTKDGDITVLVCLRPRKNITLEQTHSLLVHEAVHIWQEIRDHIGESKPSSEFEAYTVQWLSQQLFYAYRDLRKVKRGV